MSAIPVGHFLIGCTELGKGRKTLLEELSRVEGGGEWLEEFERMGSEGMVANANLEKLRNSSFVITDQPRDIKYFRKEPCKQTNPSKKPTQAILRWDLREGKQSILKTNTQK